MLLTEDQGKKWYRHWWGMAIIAGSIFGSAILLAVGLYFYQAVGHFGRTGVIDLTEGDRVTGSKEQILAGGKNYSSGPDKADLTIVLFADFACPNCRTAFTSVRELMSRYRDRVRFVFRDYPVVSEYSYTLALAARCAGEQGFFWPMHDRIFQARVTPSTQGELEAMAVASGADLARFRTCVTAEKPKADIIADLNAGEALGVSGTPTFFLNGTMVEGAIPYETFKNIIEGEID